jgi:putative DNA primase/helicase
MNTLPDIDDTTHGMWRRLYLIDFPRKFSEKEMDVELTDKLMNELSGIFNWALEGYRRLRVQKFIFSESSTMQRKKRKYKSQNNSVLDFIDNCFKISEPGDSISFKEAYEIYKRFCISDGCYNPYSKKDFRGIMEKEGYLIKNSSKHANQLRIYGINYGQGVIS